MNGGIQKEDSERLKSNFRRSSLPLPPVPLLLFPFLPVSSLIRTVVSYCSCCDHCRRKHHQKGKHKESFCLPPPPAAAPAVTLPGKRDRRRSCAARWLPILPLLEHHDSGCLCRPRSASFLAGIATGIGIDSCCHRSRGGTREQPSLSHPRHKASWTRAWESKPTRIHPPFHEKRMKWL